MSGLTKAEVAEIARLEADVDGWERSAHLHLVAEREARACAGRALARRVNIVLPSGERDRWEWHAGLAGACVGIGYRLTLYLYWSPYMGWTQWFASVLDKDGAPKGTVILSGGVAEDPVAAVRGLLAEDAVNKQARNAKRADGARREVEKFLADCEKRRSDARGVAEGGAA